MTGHPTIHILGAGALGSLWAAKLAANNNVILLIRKKNHQHLFQFELIDNHQAVPVALPCEASSADGGTIDTLLVFTKSYDTLTAVRQLRQRITPATRIVLFQNGLGSQQEVIELLPEHQIYAASTTEGANRPMEKQVVYAGKGRTWVGSISTGSSPASPEKRELVELLSSSTLDVSHTPEIWRRLWIKLSINCAINPFTALLNCPNGAIKAHAYFRTRIDPLCRELAEAMQLNHIDTSPDGIRSMVDEIIASTASNLSSMLQDVRAERKTEIEYINGYIEKVAIAHNRRFPVNLELLQAVRRKFGKGG